jgi:hypothetical protein
MIEQMDGDAISGVDFSPPARRTGLPLVPLWEFS